MNNSNRPMLKSLHPFSDALIRKQLRSLKHLYENEPKNEPKRIKKDKNSDFSETIN